jgi:hypothetical protein
MQKTTLDLQKLSDCVTKETMVDDIFLGLMILFGFLGQVFNAAIVSVLKNHPPTLYVYWDNDQTSDDFEVEGFDKDDDD